VITRKVKVNVYLHLYGTVKEYLNKDHGKGLVRVLLILYFTSTTSTLEF
jgi:hypothetical protein